MTANVVVIVNVLLFNITVSSDYGKQRVISLYQLFYVVYIKNPLVLLFSFFSNFGQFIRILLLNKDGYFALICEDILNCGHKMQGCQ